jgi:predicted Fe-Mo cluster-binding NifX family protein
VSRRIAICALNERVAPRSNHSEELFVITIGEGNQIIERKVVSISLLDLESLPGLLGRMNVETLICGGLKENSKRKFDQLSIKCIDNVIGSVDGVIEKYVRGNLRSGDLID